MRVVRHRSAFGSPAQSPGFRGEAKGRTGGRPRTEDDYRTMAKLTALRQIDFAVVGLSVVIGYMAYRLRSFLKSL
jgi:hypothetical protein